MFMIMLIRVYICRKPDGFTLIWTILHVGNSCVHNQLSIEILWLAL